MRIGFSLGLRIYTGFRVVLGGTSTPGPCVRGVFVHVQPPPCSKSILHFSSIHAQTIIHAQTTITFVFQEHTLTGASMPSLYASNPK